MKKKTKKHLAVISSRFEVWTRYYSKKKNQTFKAERFSRQYSLFGLRAMLLLLSFVFQPVVTSKQQNYRDNAP